MQHRSPTDASGQTMARPGASPDGLALTAGGIEKSYRRSLWSPRKRVRVLAGAEIALEPGEVVGLVGENGSGKSTLMRILVGDLRPDAGLVTRSGLVGYCPQEPLVYPRLTCDEHFDLFGRAYGMTTQQERDSRAAIYDSLGFERFAATRADQLSGGTLAKLNLGLALLPDPALLLLDEPYAGFDWDTYLKFWDLVDERRAAGRTVLIVSHFVVDEARFDRIVEIRDGRTGPR
ncbi:MAG: ATP-binding cassette domain-containing protein [Nocardioides sp.]|nr:ATP-binding cassette domain-containing protein [Nocardioides sp.]